MKQSHLLHLYMAALLMLLTACGTSGPSIRSYEHGKADLSSYRTYAFMEAAGGEFRNPRVPGFIRTAIEREMRAIGYQQVSDAPDLLVNFHLQTEDKDTVSTSPASYFGWRGGYHWAADPVRDQEITTYTAGTLNVDIIDRVRNELVWEGVAVGRIKEQSLQNPEPAIDSVIAEIFQRYPLPAQPRRTSPTTY